MNKRPVVNRALQYGFEDGYRGLLTVGRYPVGIVLVEAHPRFVDVNIHPTKREIRFRDERAAHDALREIIRDRLAEIEAEVERPAAAPPPAPAPQQFDLPTLPEQRVAGHKQPPAASPAQAMQTEFIEQETRHAVEGVQPQAMYEPVGRLPDAPLQIFDTYLVVPEEDRLLIIDQHALHERLTYDALRGDLEDHDYAAQQLAVPLLVDVPPSHAKLLESNIGLFAKLGIEIEPFGPTTFQVTAICHLYDESRVPDTVYRVLDELAQGDLFDRQDVVSDLLRLAVEACRGAVKAGDRLLPEERRGLLEGFRRLRPPYTCPHGRPIIIELTQVQMEKSFRRKQ
jgi:DNA mismatch repair protein MutL